MKLTELIEGIRAAHASESGVPVSMKRSAAGDLDIGSLHYSAQDVKPGGLFVAIPGLAADGHDFIDEAIANGAVAVVSQKPLHKKVVVITVENSRKALSHLAARFYDHPAKGLCIIGITGTNGKTTTAYLCEGILNKAGFRVGVIGTINYRYGGSSYANPVTTPESLDLQRILAEMSGADVTHVVLEVSSHALDLFRVTDCWLDVGIFTNLSQDHLDYHGDINAYWLCKQRMFTDHLTTGPKRNRAAAVINCADPKGEELYKKLTLRRISHGLENGLDIWPENIEQRLSGSHGTLHTPRGDIPFTSPLVGAHNVENILGATGMGLALRIPHKKIKAGIESVTMVPGRLESVMNSSGRFVFVDYAHTPDALENVLTALKSLPHDRIICIFGCGGDRDRKKRPLMGEIAGRLSDLAVITSDNPRTESPEKIIAQIQEGILKTSPHKFLESDFESGFETRGHIIEPNRKKAIVLGIRISRPGDTVLIAGKGHETYQVIGKETVPFDDRLVAEKALSEIPDGRETERTMTGSG